MRVNGQDAAVGKKERKEVLSLIHFLGAQQKEKEGCFLNKPEKNLAASRGEENDYISPSPMIGNE